MIVNKIKNFIANINIREGQHHNLAAYRSSAIVKYYQTQNPQLQPAEQSILSLLMNALQSMSMLDIGVGAGRTTYYFAPLVNHYIGIDYSDAMVTACQESYPDYTFRTASVVDLSLFEDDCFDLVLFSFNGLDSITPEERSKALSEMRRVLRPNGTMVFSSHNLQSYANHVAYKIPFTLSQLKRNYRSFVLRKVNPTLSELQSRAFCMLVDGSHGYQIKNYWVTPDHQLTELNRLGFKPLYVFGRDGKNIPFNNLTHCTDTWLYYFTTLV